MDQSLLDQSPPTVHGFEILDYMKFPRNTKKTAEWPSAHLNSPVVRILGESVDGNGTCPMNVRNSGQMSKIPHERSLDICPPDIWAPNVGTDLWKSRSCKVHAVLPTFQVSTEEIYKCREESRRRKNPNWLSGAYCPVNADICPRQVPEF